MRIPRGYRIGCVTVLLLAVVALVLAMRWWTAPIDIPRPQRPSEPADNPYDVYRSLAAYTAQIFRNDFALAYAERELFPSRQKVRLDRPELASYLLRQVQPVRLEYRRHLHKPCVVIMEYTPAWTFPELAEFRRWASIEALDMVLAAQEQDYARVVENYRTVLLLAEQIRNRGNLMHYHTGFAMQAAVNNRMSEILRLLPAQQCEQVVQVVREWEKSRVSPVQAVEVERDFYLTLLHDLYAGKYEASRTLAENRLVARWNPRWLNLRRAAREGMAFFARAREELSKPVNQQNSIGEPSHPLAKLFMPVVEPVKRATGYHVSRIRILGCAAAVRAYRLRHGSYPATLHEAGVSDLNRDPFTGGAFVYKPAGDRFLLYSVGEDGVDNGGRRAPEYWGGKGDVTLVPFHGRRIGSGAEVGEPVWLQ